MDATSSTSTDAAMGGGRKRIRSEVSKPQASLSSSPPSRQRSLRDSREPPPPPKRVACTHCRQSKLRCDSPKDPCSRCARLGLECKKDFGFKRVNKKSKIDELEKHVQELRSVMDQHHPSASIMGNSMTNIPQTLTHQSVPASSYPQRTSNLTSVDSPAANHVSTATFTRPFTNSQSVVQDSPQAASHVSISTPAGSSNKETYRPIALKVRAIESTALAREQIDSLFQIYFENFHPFFPLLNPTKAPDEYYESSPLLFWTVIAVAARRYHEDTSILPCLAEAVPKLVWERAADPPLTYDGLHSLLILCMWPFPDTHMWSDVSTVLSNIALNAAFHMGLHRPEHVNEFTRNIRARRPNVFGTSDALERRKTWGAINIVAQYLAQNVGYPPTGCCFDWSIERACEPGNVHSLTDDIRYHLIIQRFSHRMAKIMSANIADPLGLPADDQHVLLVKMLEHELNSLKGQILDSLSAIDRTYFRFAELQLGIYHWLGPSSTDRTVGIVRSYATATTLIKEVLSADASFGALSYGPANYARMMLTAGYLVLRVILSNLSQLIDSEAGITLLHSAVAALRRYSIQENDQTARVANILADIWSRRHEIFPDISQEPFLITRSRLGASLLIDCLWRWKEECLRNEGTTSTATPGRQISEKTMVAVENEPQPFDLNPFAFDWDLFNNLNWSWNFDISPITEN